MINSWDFPGQYQPVKSLALHSYSAFEYESEPHQNA